MRSKKMSQAMAFIVLFGIVSLFSDMTHEGASSIRGAYLALLGASAGTIGFISGLGELVGGPMYYIKNGLGKKWMILAYAYAFFGVCAVFGTGNATQVNTITAAIDAALLNFNLLPAAQMPTCNLIIGIVICIVVGLLYLFGGPLLSPMFAGAAMSLSSVCVVGNALRLGRAKL